MSYLQCSVVIRTFNSANMLPITLEFIRLQSIKPERYITVDSGSTENTLDLLSDKAVIHNYIVNEFNYSKALNQGVDYVSEDYVCIISSHTLLQNKYAIEGLAKLCLLPFKPLHIVIFPGSTLHHVVFCKSLYFLRIKFIKIKR